MTRLILKGLIVFALTCGLAIAAEPTLVERAEKGDVSAQIELGRKYGFGRGVPKDSAEAVRWHRKAAEQGNAVAQFNLGVMYARGDGVVKDSAEAVKWYRMAAEQGNALAQCTLGLMLAIGDGVAKDEIEGLAWIYVAAASGDETSLKAREAIERGLGTSARLAAQQRSKQIVKEIEAKKRASAAEASRDLFSRD